MSLYPIVQGYLSYQTEHRLKKERKKKNGGVFNNLFHVLCVELDFWGVGSDGEHWQHEMEVLNMAFTPCIPA